MAPRSDARESGGIRKLQRYLAELKVLKRELLPDEDDKKRNEEMKTLDDYGRKKYELMDMIKDVREDIDRLNESRKASHDGRDVHTIRLQTDNNRKLRDAAAVFNELKGIHLKDEKKNPKRKGKKKIDDKDMADRRKYLLLVAEELKELMNQNGRTRAVLDDREEEIKNRVEKRKEDKRRMREERSQSRKRERSRSRSRRTGETGAADDGDDDFKPVVVDQQVQAFEEKVQQNIREQDEMLKEIGEGLDELKMLAQEANKQLVIQKEMLDQVENKIETTTRDFKSANKRLQELLDESGGMSRWCPILICLVILLALGVYIFKLG